MAVDSTHEELLTWTKGTDILSFKRLYLPNHVNSNHWVLLDVDTEKGSIYASDSMTKKTLKQKREPFGANHPSVAALRKYLDFYSKIKRNRNVCWTEGASISRNVPQQRNDSDCGPFMCALVTCCALKWSLKYDANKMSAMRTKMALFIAAAIQKQETASCASAAPVKPKSPITVTASAPVKPKSPVTATASAPVKYKSPVSASAAARVKHKSPATASATALVKHKSPVSASAAAPLEQESNSLDTDLHAKFSIALEKCVERCQNDLGKDSLPKAEGYRVPKRSDLLLKIQRLCREHNASVSRQSNDRTHRFKGDSIVEERALRVDGDDGDGYVSNDDDVAFLFKEDDGSHKLYIGNVTEIYANAPTSGNRNAKTRVRSIVRSKTKGSFTVRWYEDVDGLLQLSETGKLEEISTDVAVCIVTLTRVNDSTKPSNIHFFKLSDEGKATLEDVRKKYDAGGFTEGVNEGGSSDSDNINPAEGSTKGVDGGGATGSSDVKESEQPLSKRPRRRRKKKAGSGLKKTVMKTRRSSNKKGPKTKVQRKTAATGVDEGKGVFQFGKRRSWDTQII